MRLTSPLYRLPVRFDAARLLAEVMAIPRVMWRPDRFGIDGYWSLNLVAWEGKNSDLQSTPMRATGVLERCPYTRQVLESFATPWAEVRFRWLEGARSLPPHWDANHFWFERVRLHIPVVTNQSVQFVVDDESVCMGEGECWLFDRQRRHSVMNASPYDRIHLVMDTRGSPRLWELVQRASEAAADVLAFDPEREARVETELGATAVVLSPQQVTTFAEAVVARLAAGTRSAAEPWLGRVRRRFAQFSSAWAELWASAGDAEEAWERYRGLLHGLERDARALEAAPDAPRIARELELGDRAGVLGRSGGLGAVVPAHARCAAPVVRERLGELRVEPAEEYLFRLLGDELVFVDDQRLDGTACTIEELLLLAALGQGLSVRDAAASVGLAYDTGLLERVEELVEAGVLRAYLQEPRDAVVASANRVERADAPAAGEAAAAIPGHQYVERSAEIYIRLLERGQAGVWVPQLNRFQSLELLAVALLVAIGDGCRLDEALARAQLGGSDAVDAVIHALVGYGLLRIGESPGVCP